MVAVAGSEYNVLSQLNSLPRVPISGGDLATGGIITAFAAIVASLGGAMLGGLAVMSRHVGQSTDGWLGTDGGVDAMVIVEVQPPRQLDVALLS